jgi:hypothetical protein
LPKKLKSGKKSAEIKEWDSETNGYWLRVYSGHDIDVGKIRSIPEQGLQPQYVGGYRKTYHGPVMGRLDSLAETLGCRRVLSPVWQPFSAELLATTLAQRPIFSEYFLDMQEAPA